MKLVIIALISGLSGPLMAATVPVRYPEGLTRGYLLLRSQDGKLLAHGDLIQLVDGDELDKRMVFHFADGSIYDERVRFTEKEVFRLKSYKLTERGPSFDADREISLNAGTGAYKVTTKERKDGKEKVHDGTIEVPGDLYNGMIITIVKDLPKEKGETVHFAAFMPDPKVIELEFIPTGEADITIGDLKDKAVHYRVKAHLGFWTQLFAKILGRMPPDLHVWVSNDGGPAFVAFEGPITSGGPIWRIEVVSPQLAR